jgi:hypothetical protein
VVALAVPLHVVVLGAINPTIIHKAFDKLSHRFIM